MTSETVRYPDALADFVEDEVVDELFGSKSDFYRFAAQYTLDSLGVEDEGVFSQDYLEKKSKFDERLEGDLPVLRPRRKGEDAIDKIYSGYIMENERILQQGVMELAELTDYSLEDYARTALDKARERLE